MFKKICGSKSSSILAQMMNDLYLMIIHRTSLGQCYLAICENVYAELDFTYNMQGLPCTTGSFVPCFILGTSSKISYNLPIDVFALFSKQFKFFQVSESLLVQNHLLCELVTNLLEPSLYVPIAFCVCTLLTLTSTREKASWVLSDGLSHPCMPPSAFFIVALNNVKAIY